MRREGSMAVHTLFHLHKAVRSDFSSVPIYFIKYKGSFYLALVLLETAVKVTRAGAADKASLQAFRPSQHPRDACCSPICPPPATIKPQGFWQRWISTALINKEKKESIWLIMQLAGHCRRSALFCVCVLVMYTKWCSQWVAWLLRCLSCCAAGEGGGPAWPSAFLCYCGWSSLCWLCCGVVLFVLLNSSFVPWRESVHQKSFTKSNGYSSSHLPFYWEKLGWGVLVLLYLR